MFKSALTGVLPILFLISPAFAQKDFPDGPAKEYINKICLQCHATKINMNKAKAEDIVTAIGLTPEEAKALVAYREKHGDYREWGEMLVVYGVDGRKLQAAKDKMSL
jgi:competence ComEA-like helix-hairpin-helix protein